jgi:hypothetical protein
MGYYFTLRRSHGSHFRAKDFPDVPARPGISAGMRMVRGKGIYHQR